jgi:hypothetical protein
VSGLQCTFSRGRVAALAALFAWAALAQAASAQTVPPGNSEIEQYVPTLPGPEGDHPVDGNAGGGGDGTEESGLPPATLQQLRALGPEGQATAEGLTQTASGTEKEPSQARRGTDGSRGESASEPGSAVGAVADSLVGESDGGMGIVLPLILAATLGLAVTYLVAGRRRAADRGGG